MTVSRRKCVIVHACLLVTAPSDFTEKYRTTMGRKNTVYRPKCLIFERMEMKRQSVECRSEKRAGSSRSTNSKHIGNPNSTFWKTDCPRMFIDPVHSFLITTGTANKKLDRKEKLNSQRRKRKQRMHSAWICIIFARRETSWNGCFILLYLPNETCWSSQKMKRRNEERRNSKTRHAIGS